MNGPWLKAHDAIQCRLFFRRGVAQPGSASALGAEGRRFESCLPDQISLSRAKQKPEFLAIPAAKLSKLRCFVQTRIAVIACRFDLTSLTYFLAGASNQNSRSGNQAPAISKAPTTPTSKEEVFPISNSNKKKRLKPASFSY